MGTVNKKINTTSETNPNCKLNKQIYCEECEEFDLDYVEKCKNQIIDTDIFISEQKDYMRARNCNSEAKAEAQMKAIKDLNKLFRRAKAFITVGTYGNSIEKWMDRAKALGASEKMISTFLRTIHLKR